MHNDVAQRTDIAGEPHTTLLTPMPRKSAHQRSVSPAQAAAADGRVTELRELQLVEAHREGDPDALSELLQSYQKRVYSVCYRMLRNVDEAADLTQDTLVRLVENLHKYDGRAKLSTWIIRIAMNACISHMRKTKVRKSVDQAGPFEGSLVGVVNTAELSSDDRVEQQETHSLLDKAMMSLDPDMRSVLVLRDMQGLEYEQLAEALEIPVGTVKSRLFRARAALRNAMIRFE